MYFADDDVPRPATALSLLNVYHSSAALSVGCPVLHAALGDPARGLSPHGVTEISGESSAGKTQLCLTLVVRTVMQALLCPSDRVRADASSPSDVLFVNTEDRFPTPRLHQIAEETAAAALSAGYPVDVLRGFRVPAAANEAPVPVPCAAAAGATAAAAGAPPHKRFAASASTSSSSSSASSPPLSPAAAAAAVADTILRRIMIAEIASDEELLEVLVRAPGIAYRQGLRLLVVDSVAALFRGEIYGLAPTASSSSRSSSNSNSTSDGGGGRGSGSGTAAPGTVSPANTYAARAARLSKIAASLKALQVACPHMAIVVTNQVADVVMDAAGRGLLALLGGSGRAIAGAGAVAGTGAGAGGAASKSSSSSSSSSSSAATLPPTSSFAVPVPGDGDRLVRPALGPSWDAMVTTRIMLTHLRGLPPVEVPAAAAPPLPLERGALPLPAVLPAGREREGSDAASSGAVVPSSAPGPAPPSSSSSSSAAAAADASTAASTDPQPAALDDGSGDIARLAATSDSVRTTVREAHLLLSPAYPRRRCRFAVVRGGLRGIASSGDGVSGPV